VHGSLGDQAGVLIFGVDSPDVPDAMIDLCCVAVGETNRDARVLLAPTVDGGFWSIGFGGRVDSAELLRGIEWSSGRELVQVAGRATSLGYEVIAPPATQWGDIDHPSDLRKLLDRLSQSKVKSDRELYNALSFVPRDRLNRAE
jgi:glycosyltransferase A (GT-A) superfamily protein (DUF2064 family)